MSGKPVECKDACHKGSNASSDSDMIEGTIKEDNLLTDIGFGLKVLEISAPKVCMHKPSAVLPYVPPYILNKILSMTHHSAASKVQINYTEEKEDMRVERTPFTDYVPKKLSIGKQHPDPIVESPALASLPPPDICYQVMIPEDTINNGSLSAMQLEAVTYSCQQHEKELLDGSTAGFFLGDGTGVGKGRTVCGIIFENYLRGRKQAVWCCTSPDLIGDVIQGFRDIGAEEINVRNLADFNDKIIIPEDTNVIFCSYDLLVKKGRLDQLVKWCGEKNHDLVKAFNGVIVLDECHRAKTLATKADGKSSATATKVIELLNQLPKARVVFVSATSVSNLRDMSYMARLGLWGPGTQFESMS